MRRVVFLIRNIAPESFGGGEMYQIELAKVLKKNDYEPVIFTASNRLIEEAKKNKIKYERAPYLKWQNWSSWRNALLPFYWLWQKRLKTWYKDQIKKYNPAVLNIQSRDELIGASLAGLECGKKVVWTDHTDFRIWSLINVNKRFKNQVGKWILRCAKKVNKIILINDFEKKWLEKQIRPRKLDNLLVIRNGMIDEYQEYCSEPKEKDSFYYVGRISNSVKGIDILIKAFLLVVKDNKTAVLNLYGDGVDLINNQELAKGEGRIRFHGFTDEPLKAVSSNEIFVLPSYHEGLSLSLLDAAMMGKKIIASDIDGNKEVVEDGKTGLLISAGDVDKLALAMKKMLNDKKKATEMAKNAREKFKKEFDLETIFKNEMSEIYEESERE